MKIRKKNGKPGFYTAGIVWLLIIMLVLTGTGTAASEPASSAKTSENQTTDSSQSLSEEKKAAYVALFDSKTAGVMTGTPQDQFVRTTFPSARLEYFNNVADMALALQMKKVDFVVLPTVNYYGLAQQYPTFGYLNMPIVKLDVGAIFPKTDRADKLRREFNEYLTGLKSSGEMEKLQNYWLYPRDWENIDIPSEGKGGTLSLAVVNTLQPFSFMLNGKNAGLDIAVLAGFAKACGYGLRIENGDFSGVLSGIASKKYDMAVGQIAWTRERAESVDYSDFYAGLSIVPIFNTENIRTDDTVVAGASNDPAVALTGKLSSATGKNDTGILSSIRRTLLDQNRWVNILQGLGVTLVITLLGFLLANILGAVFCALSRARSRMLRILAGVYSALMQGLPVVVILMLLYYVVFGHLNLSNVLVAVLGFGLIFGAYLAQLFAGSIESVDKGQWEAALASGLTRRQAFRGIVLPQAVRAMLPGYFSQLISLLKGTAVVGYIAVTDLTKVGDIIRSSTYEAVVPLLTVALIYLALAGICLLAMSRISRYLARPQVRKKSLPERGKE